MAYNGVVVPGIMSCSGLAVAARVLRTMNVAYDGTRTK